MKPCIRKSIKILLINDANKLLLMCIDDPNCTNLDGKPRPHFWAPIGGKIEKDETMLQVAIRELFEETGLPAQDVSFGPVVWREQFELLLHGQRTLCDQEFIVAKATNSDVSLVHLTEDERPVIKQLAWFSLEDIKHCPDVIYPLKLPDILPDILKGNYPIGPIIIDENATMRTR